jgi:hypothetical protein
MLDRSEGRGQMNGSLWSSRWEMDMKLMISPQRTMYVKKCNWKKEQNEEVQTEVSEAHTEHRMRLLENRVLRRIPGEGRDRRLQRTTY